MKKRILSLALSLLMLLSMFPMTAFAADPVIITIGNVTANAGETVSVPVTISGATNAKFATMIIDFDVPTGLSITGATIGSEAAAVGMSIDELSNYSEGKITINGNLTSGSSPADGTLLTLTVAVDATATGTYTITGGPKDNNAGNISDCDEEDVVCQFTPGTITVGTVSTADYTAALSSTAPEVTKGEDVSVTVTVDGMVGTYNAAEITLSYPSILTYKGIAASGTGDEITVDSNTTGKLYIVDKGGENAKGTTYTVTFTSVATGEANVTLDNAAFGTRLASQTNSLTTADITASSVKVTVKPQTFDVTFPDDAIIAGNKLFTTTQTPTEGTDFVFTATNSNYEYSNVVVKVGADESSATEISGVTYDQTTGWTVPGASITGNLYVTATAIPINYAVTYSYVDKDGQTQTGTANEATYGTPYVYTMPGGVAASGVTDGFHYEVDTLTISGTASTAYQQNITEKTVTITGTAITGPIAITLKKVTDSADSWAVAVNAADDITTSEYSVASSVKKGDTISLTVIPQTGYTYTVTAKTTDDDTNVPLTQNGNVYTTTAGVTENITFVVTRAVDTGSFEWELYLEGGMGEGEDPNENMYLVKIGTKIADKHYTIDGKNMYWSEKYGTYAYVVIADTAPTADAFTFTIENNAEDVVYEVSYDKNVNKSADGTVDANDAQLVYDMYNKEYKLVTDNVSVLKFLEADVATTEGKGNLLDVNDAAAIVTAVLERMNGSTN